jgi:hypothetical protein
MIEFEYDNLDEILSHQASWIQCELGMDLAEVLLEELNEIN